MMKQIFTLLCTVLFSGTLFAGPVTVTAKAISETVEFAAKKSGKVLTPAARKSAELALSKAVAGYGDDVLKTVSRGGLETLEAGAKYGDDFWHLCKGATPDAVRSLALHGDDLMPIAKRLGADFMMLEGKAPGLGAKVVQSFGDDGAKALAKAPADDISKLVGYAGKADSPETVKFLHETYKKGGTNFLNNLNWKTVMAGGLSVAVITAAYNVSQGVKEGMVIAAEKDPEGFRGRFDSFTAPVRYGLSALFILLLLPVGMFSWKLCCKLRK